jgi:hypothetical protein
MAPLPCLIMLEKTRPSLIFAAIALHKPTIMSETKWKHAPWSLHPERIDSLKLLFDILADCPRLFVLRDELLSYSDEDTRMTVARNLSRQCHQVIARLEDWGKLFACDPFHTPDEIPACQTAPLIEDVYGTLHPAWSTIFRYRSLYHANAVAVYNAATIMVLRFADSIDTELRSCSRYHARQDRISAAALSICRSIDYHQQEHWSQQGSLDLLFPLRMAYDGISEKDPTVALWIQAVVHNIAAGRRGLWRSARSLLELGK